ncbi:peroxide stress protein YaaA [Aliiroseovarius crassostreae]|uniref:peroxide stress protein YaaA n=1 Tax=Aliiroseovarius crassostreae TaxID=154981 RepID=UPI0021FAA044|nr:peroxide stress protein YaaA [Aliiroseovarius crassostreae]UWQ11212.1 peroxide stress protein YaaA [Aliiroseovarius crassostreae]
MLVVVSPAKRLDETDPKAQGGSTPLYLEQASELARTAGALTAQDLEKLMHISPKLGALNAQRFTAFGSGQGEKQALEMFAGDTYAGLDAPSLGEDARRYAQDHLCILSGLYGLLRPEDLIAPHRLEMGSRLKNARGKNLYEFWGDRIAEAINARAEQTHSSVLVNCASVEYFSAANRDILTPRVITPSFYEMKNGTPKIVSFYAKKARGAMARYVMENRLTDPEDLRGFDLGGYQYHPEMSDGDSLAFLRDAEG